MSHPQPGQDYVYLDQEPIISPLTPLSIQKLPEMPSGFLEKSERNNQIRPVIKPSTTEFDPERDIKQAEMASKALMKLIDKTKPLIMNGKRYLYFEHWQTIGRFFGYTVGTDWTHKIENGYEARALLYNREGMIIGGAEAACLRDEKQWLYKPEFQLRSMAQTRAMSKALRSNFGSVAVLAGLEATPAEEMSSDAILEPFPGQTAYNNATPAPKTPVRGSDGLKTVIKDPSAPATNKQKQLIEKLCNDLEATDGSVTELFGGQLDMTELKKGFASQAIEKLMTALRQAQKKQFSDVFFTEENG